MVTSENRISRRPPSLLQPGLSIEERDALLAAGYTDQDIEVGIEDRASVIAMLLLKRDHESLETVFGFDEESLYMLAVDRPLGPTGSVIRANGKSDGQHRR